MLFSHFCSNCDDATSEVCSFRRRTAPKMRVRRSSFFRSINSLFASSNWISIVFSAGTNNFCPVFSWAYIDEITKYTCKQCQRRLETYFVIGTQLAMNLEIIQLLRRDGNHSIRHQHPNSLKTAWAGLNERTAIATQKLLCYLIYGSNGLKLCKQITLFLNIAIFAACTAQTSMIMMQNEMSITTQSLFIVNTGHVGHTTWNLMPKSVLQ